MGNHDGIHLPDTVTICPLACGHVIYWPDPDDYKHLARMTMGRLTGEHDRGSFVQPDLDVEPCIEAMLADIEALLAEHLRHHERTDW